MKKIVLYIMLTISVFLITGCSNAKNDDFEETPQLYSLKVGQGELSPVFSSDALEYSVEVANECEDLELFPQVEKDINIEIQKPDKLSVGENLIKIILTKDSSYKKATYSINVTRLPSDNCKLASLSLGNKIQLSPEFSADNYNYTVEVGYDSSLDITAVAEDDAKIEITGNENFQLGENTVTIKVTSPSQLYSSEYTIKVNKTSTVPWWQEAINNGNDKFIAITFDDGPSKYTPKLLDILDKHEIKATFFVVGNRVGSFHDILKDTSDRGHEIANHSWDHSFMRSDWSDSKKWNNIDKCNKAVEEITGVIPTSFRPPGGIWDRSIKKFHDMDVVFWSVDPEDWKYRDTEIVSEHIINNTNNGDIILLHDLYETSVDAADIVIGELKDKGYNFVTVNELLQIKEYKRSLDSGDSAE